MLPEFFINKEFQRNIILSPERIAFNVDITGTIFKYDYFIKLYA
jgi:hypothetical protein